MACACKNSQKSAAKPTTFKHTASNGQTKVYRSEIEAAAAVRRSGGTYSAS